MSIQEKKSNKGTPYAIIKFSDEKREFELFVFAEILVNNRMVAFAILAYGAVTSLIFIFVAMIRSLGKPNFLS